MQEMTEQTQDENPESESITITDQEVIERLNYSTLDEQDLVNFISLWKGSKPAAYFDLLLAPEYFSSDEPELDDRARDFQELLDSMGIPYYLGIDESTPLGIYATFIIGKNIHSLDRLYNAYFYEAENRGDYDREFGHAVGYPDTAVEAYAKGKSALLDRNNLPKSLKDPEILNFLTFRLSKDHWEEELEEVRKTAKLIKQVSPDLYDRIINLSDKSHTGTTINDWAKAAKDAGSNELGKRLDEDKMPGLQALERMNLPRYKQLNTTLDSFLKNSDEYFDEIGSNKFYINLPPLSKDYQRFRQIDLTRIEALRYIESQISPEDTSHYSIIISEYFENLYSGNIVINPDGRVLVEMVAGSHAPLVSGAKTPEMTIKRDPFLKTFQYSFEDLKLRQIMWDTLNVIPSTGEGRDKEFTPGYYEFTLIQREKDKPLEPIFLDYRDNPAYHLPST